MSTVSIQLYGTYLTVADAAIAAKVTSGRIRQLVREGVLSVIKIDDRSYLIPESEIAKIATPSEKGRPRGARNKKT